MTDKKTIEDEIFFDLTKLTKGMYEPSSWPHLCSMCHEVQKLAGYKLKLEYVTSFEQPYIFICKECYEQLPIKGGEK